MTADCRKIIDEAIEVVSPKSAILNHCRREGTLLHIGTTDAHHHHHQTYDLKDYEDILLIAFGKASSGMASALLEVLVGPGDNEDVEISDKLSGMVIVKDNHAKPWEMHILNRHGITVQEASHPVPDARSVNATQKILRLVEQVANNNNASGRKTLILVCISGGGSALFCAPHPRLSLEDLQVTNTALLQSGMSIQEMNVIRKKLEVGKGGGLLARALGTSTTTTTTTTTSNTMVSLILSDVVGDPLDLIASGPTVPDTSTWQNAWELVQQRKGLAQALPRAVLNLLEDGKNGALQGDDLVPKVVAVSSNDATQDKSDENAISQKQTSTCLVGNNALAVERAAQVAQQQLGYHTIVLGTEFTGEAKDVAGVLVAMAQQIQQSHARLKKYLMVGESNNCFPVALIAGGETTVTLPSTTTANTNTNTNTANTNELSGGNGKGGRNQELALAAAVALRQQRLASGQRPLRNIVVASVGTDGTDGPTDAAGAIVDGGTVARLPCHNNSNAIHALQRHNSYHYLNQTDANGQSPLIRMSPTGTNVADIMIVLIGEEPSTVWSSPVQSTTSKPSDTTQETG